MKKVLFTLLAVVSMALTVKAQGPAPSPANTYKQVVGTTEITIEYSRPSVKGRTIFAEDGLVPYGKVWRTGANAATKFTFSKDINIGGKDVKAGSYAVLTKPGASEWEVMLYKYEAAGAGSYENKTPDASFKAESSEFPVSVESFMIGIGNLRDDSANLYLIWETTSVSIPLKVM